MYLDFCECFGQRVNTEIVSLCLYGQYFAKGDTLSDEPVADADVFRSIR